MKRVTITIDTKNSAFKKASWRELSRILEGLASDIYLGLRSAPATIPLYDVDGNRVGELRAE